MRITVKGRNIEITDAIRAYAEEKIGKVMNHYDQIQAIDVVLNVIKNPSVSLSHTAEVICKFNSGSVKVEESAESMYASIDLVADKIARQVKKFKEKQITSSKTASIRTDAIAEEADETVETAAE
ncbi:MAG: ribosome-associated translation inhibitor RaiA [Candidatus Gastranaerophilales bacterium]|nr:ribosome-associated translation inhibitor RaiA [Candidatus Gastranaerophilales bacterium]